MKKTYSIVPFIFLVLLLGCNTTTNNITTEIELPTEPFVEEVEELEEPQEIIIDESTDEAEETEISENFDYNIFDDYDYYYSDNFERLDEKPRPSETIPQWSICHHPEDCAVGFNGFGGAPSGSVEDSINKNKIRIYYSCNYDEISNYDGYYPALIFVESIWIYNKSFNLDYEYAADGKFAYVLDNLEDCSSNWDKLITLAREEYGESYTVNDLINNGYTNKDNPIHILPLKDFKDKDGIITVNDESLDYSYGYEEKSKLKYFTFSKHRLEEMFSIDIKENYILGSWIPVYYVPEKNQYYISNVTCPMFYTK